MTPWTRGAHTLAISRLVLLGALVAWGATVHLLAPHGLRGAHQALKQAGQYSLAWFEYLVNGGAVGVLVNQAQWQPLALVGASVICALVALLAGVVMLAEERRPTVHGTAAFATKDDCGRMGLLGNRGNLVLGEFKGAGPDVLARLLPWRRPTRLVGNAARHGLVLAGTRSGKTAGVVVPSALEYAGSQILVDAKGELAERVAPVLERRGVRVRIIDWSSPNSPDAWNPLSEATVPANLVELERHCERVAAAFYPVQKGSKDDHWQETAQRVAASLFLFCVLEARQAGTEAEAHPSDVFKLITDHRLPYSERMNRAMAAGLDAPGAEDRDPVGLIFSTIAATADVKGYPRRIVEDANSMARTHPKERSSHMTTLQRGLAVFRSAAVQAATRTSTFAWSDLRAERTAVFIRFKESDAQAYGRLSMLFFDTFFAWAVDEPPGRGDQSINVFADEFSSMPALELLDSYLAKGAGHRCTITIIVQSFKDLEKHYEGKTAQRFFENFEWMIVFALTDKETREWFSSLAGTKTVRKKSRSGGGLATSREGSTTVSESGVPLLSPESLGEIPFRQHLLFVKRHFTRPVVCTTPLHPLMKPRGPQ